MTYETEGTTYEAVCRFIGWDPRCKAVQVRPDVVKKTPVVFVCGTLLKPDEWRKLGDFSGQTMPDGTIILTLPRTKKSYADAEHRALYGAGLA